MKLEKKNTIKRHGHEIGKKNTKNGKAMKLGISQFLEIQKNTITIKRQGWTQFKKTKKHYERARLDPARKGI